MTRLTTLVASLCVLSMFAAVTACAVEATSTLFVLTTDASPKLVTVPLPSAVAVAASRPLTVSTGITITNVTPGETLVGIDVRPQTQRLYALGVNFMLDTATLYHLSPETGFAAVVGTAGSIAFTTNGVTAVDFPDPATVPWDIDFNPAVDRLRVVAGGLTFRVNPNTGLGVDGDNGGAVTTGTNPDGPVSGGTTTVSGAAYTNNQPNNGSITTLYTLDGNTNSLFIQNPPNVGTQSLGLTVTLGGNPLDFSTISGFDIPPGVNAASNNLAVTTGTGYAILTVGGVSALHSINLVTAQAQKLGNITARSMAIRTELGAVIAMDSAGASLLRFSSSAPGTVTTVGIAVGSLRASETLVGIDFRPQTGQFYGFAVDAAANNATLYLVDPQGGTLTAVGSQGQIAFTDASLAAVDLPTAASGWGIDFNPTVDRLRVTTATGLNFRLNPNTGASVDGDLGGAAGSVPGVNTDGNINGSGSTGVSGVAYTRSFAQSLTGGTTTLFTLDSVQSKIFLQTPPNAGTQTAGVSLALAGNPLSVGVLNGFDIPASIAASPEAWVGATSGGTTSLFRVDLSGAATNIGAISTGLTPIGGLTVFTTAVMLVEAPVNTVIYNNVDTVNFGTTPFGTAATRTVTLRNTGSQVLNYSTATTAPVTVTQNASGTVAPGSTVTIELTLSAAAVTTLANTLTITSSDVAVPTFTVALTGTVSAIPPTVTTPTSTGITSSGATLGGNITSNGGAAITESGVVFALTSANANPLINGTGVTKVAGTATTTGVFTVPVTGLAPNSAYSFKAYATNSLGDGYTVAGTFTTASAPPTVTTPASAGITFAGATLGGNITFDGGAAITESGVVVALTSANANPLINGTGVTKVVGTSTAVGVFTVAVTGLAPSSAYSFKAYATNSAGDGYTVVGTFTTASAPPTVTTPTSTGITSIDATLGGNITFDGGAAITESGVVIALTSDNADPLIGGTGVTKVAGTSTTTGVFTVGVTGLAPNSAYSFKAYATNSAGNGFTVVGTFTTASAPPTVATPASTGITSASATLGGNITSDGGAAIIESGVVFALTSANANPLINGSGVTKIVGTATTTGVFTVAVAGLAPNSAYSFKAFATNSKGDGYTTAGTFTTASAAPTVTTPTSTGIITSAGATLGGNITSDGGAAITESGVVFALTSANANPLINGTGVTKVVGTATTTGVFTLAVTGLAANSAYSFKAYATNSAGSGFTVVGTFTTASAPPTVTTPTSASITSAGATLGGNITSDGGAAITESGVVFALTSANANPLINGSGVTKVVGTGTTTGVFTLAVTGLVPNSAYSFKAFATNSAGSGYTTAGTFTTASAPPTLTTPTSTGITSAGATLGGNITSDGGAAITESGVVLALTSANANPLINGTGVTKAVGTSTTTGVFTVAVTGLAPNSAYSFKAYATNSAGSGYTVAGTFTSASAPPAVTTPASAGITSTGATLGGNITSDGGAAITESGVVFALTSANANPLINGAGVTKVVGSSTAVGVFTLAVTGLAPHSAYSFKAYATNSAGTGYTTAGTFTSGNTAPVISSKASATPNPAGTSQTVTLDVGATDPDGDTLSYSWSVGGNTLPGQSPTTTFPAAGTYTAAVTITDGFGGSATSSVDIVVVAPLIGTGADSDGDGFSDVYETAAGANPSSAASSPTGGVAPAIADLVESKLAVTLNFGKAASDSIAYAGTLPIPAGFSVAGKVVTVDVGGVIKALTLDAKGKSPKGNNSFSITIKSKKGVVEMQTAKFTVKFSKGDFQSSFTDEGLTNGDANKAPANIVVRVIVGGTVNQHTQAVLYTANMGKTGKATAVK